MEAPKPTAGPWKASPSAIDRDTWCIWGGEKYASGDGWYYPCIFKTMNGQDAREGSMEEAAANARLTAAAPDQNAVCLELDRLSLVIESAVRNADPDNLALVDELLRSNRAAIAKARAGK